MKTLVKQLFPAQWQYLREFKEAVKERLYPEKRFWHYYVAERDYEQIPEPFLVGLKLSDTVEEIIDVGCASGRNFMPFNGKYRLKGIDIVPRDRIKWVTEFHNLDYSQWRLKDFTRHLERNSIDLSRSLVMMTAVLMYIPRRWQIRFYKACRAKGCRNFVFIEYPYGTRSCGRTFKMPIEWFTPQKNGDHLTVAYTNLENA